MRPAEQNSHKATVAAIEDFREVDLHTYDIIIIGSSIRYGKHSKLVYDFVEGNLPLLVGKPNAFFSVNIAARKPDKNLPDTNPYLRKFINEVSWRPQKLAVFAGKLDYPKYGFFNRLMIRFIMLITHGPTDPTTVVEFTDWQQVEAFGRAVSEM